MIFRDRYNLFYTFSVVLNIHNRNIWENLTFFRPSLLCFKSLNTLSSVQNNSHDTGSDSSLFVPYQHICLPLVVA